MYSFRPAIILSGLALSLTLTACSTNAIKPETAAAPQEVKMVVVTMFEVGEDTGDTAGEFQLWKERQKLDKKYEFDNSFHDLYFNEETGVLGMVTGIGTAKSASAVMALGLDPRFDLSKAYWLVAGISGIDPEDASVGSAAWAEYLVDGDLAHEIDAREIPEDWTTGYFARYTKRPYDPNKPEPTGEMFHINPELTEWAYQLTKDIDLGDSETLKRVRSAYKGYPNAQKPPFVLKGDNLAGMTYWHGKILNEWANNWVDYWTEGKGEFVTSAMEDTGSYQSMVYLDNIGKADKDRFMVLRTGSNYTMQPPGMTAIENLLSDHDGYDSLEASVEAAYVVGSKVVNEIVQNWGDYKEKLPYLVSSPTGN
ncbi:MAG: hypothetical protein ACWA44_14545 [Thiotrichales bacterium]